MNGNYVELSDQIKVLTGTVNSMKMDSGTLKSVVLLTSDLQKRVTALEKKVS